MSAYMRAVIVTQFCLMGSNFPKYVFIPTFPIVSYHHLFVFGKPQEQFLWGHDCVSLSPGHFLFQPLQTVQSFGRNSLSSQ